VTDHLPHMFVSTAHAILFYVILKTHEKLNVVLKLFAFTRN
jgi:hypothetical protein